jgi:hypothetical protein
MTYDIHTLIHLPEEGYVAHHAVGGRYCYVHQWTCQAYTQSGHYSSDVGEEAEKEDL